MKSLFVTTSYIKNYGIVEGNLDDKLITSTIRMVQDINLQPILGSSLYNAISDQIANNTLTAANTTLLDDYIAPYMLWMVVAEGTVIFNYRYSNKAVNTMNSENQFPVTMKELELLQAKYSAKADFYGKRMSLFLEDNPTNYPLFRNNNTNLEDLEPKIVKYQSGFNLNGSRRKRSNQKPNWPYCNE